MSIEEALQLLLRERESRSQCRIWEHKTFNIHRGVLLWRVTRNDLTSAQMSAFIREQIKDSFRISWWRGFGFGVLIESPTLPDDIEVIIDNIDSRAKSRGTWQWTVLVCPPLKIAFGVHMWMEGYLTPVYLELLRHYETEGFQAAGYNLEKSTLMKFVTGAASLAAGRTPDFND